MGEPHYEMVQGGEATFLCFDREEAYLDVENWWLVHRASLPRFIDSTPLLATGSAAAIVLSFLEILAMNNQFGSRKTYYITSSVTESKLATIAQ